jgi:hypothetical protein
MQEIKEHEEPFDTVTSIGYGDYLQNLPIKSITKKSKMVLTGSISLVMTPKFSYMKRSNMSDP